ncbi:MAG: hypothetical protein II949_11855 [Prevotella sp.]|nr:hypothetical protein [Prevotella sp.]
MPPQVGAGRQCRGRPIPEQARLPVAFVPARWPVRASVKGQAMPPQVGAGPFPSKLAYP